MIFAFILQVVLLMSDNSLTASSYVVKDQEACEAMVAELGTLAKEDKTLKIKEAYYQCEEFSVDTVEDLKTQESI